MKTKIALITGGSRGLGKSSALHLARAGYDIIFTFHSNELEANKTAASIRELGKKANFLKLDTSQTKSFPAFTKQVRDLLNKDYSKENFDVLVNNAGIGIHAPFTETTEEQFDQLMNIHLKGVFFLTQNLLPLLSDGGRILNISSGLARFSLPGYSAYACMKGAIEVLTRYLAKELGDRKISVNTIAPGAIETDFANGTVRDNKTINKVIADQTALGRVGLPEDIGAVVAALASEETKWINAQRIEASGGMFL